MRLQVDLTDTHTEITLPDQQGTITIQTTPQAAPAHGLRLNVVNGVLASFGENTADEVVLISVPWTSEPEYVQRGLAGETVPAAQQAYVDAVKLVLKRFGIALQAPKKKPAKARHRFIKALASVAFHVARNGSEATVYWTARNVMTVKAGAQLTREFHLNKDGSMAYGTKYGEKLRADHQATITDFTTTQDIELRSVNEVGLFLYYGDTNGWLELVNDDGKSLDELTKVDA